LATEVAFAMGFFSPATSSGERSGPGAPGLDDSPGSPVHIAQNALLRRLAVLQLVSVLPAAPPVVYLVGLLLDLSDREFWLTATTIVPVYFITFGSIFPLLYIWTVARAALQEAPDDEPGDRLQRLLELPRRLEVGTVGIAILGAFIALGVLVGWLHRDPMLVLPAALVIVCYALLAAVWLGFALTRELAPVTVEEFHRHPDARVSASPGVLWRRQGWYLPYLLATLVVTALITCAIVLSRFALRGLNGLTELFPAQPGLRSASAKLLETAMAGLATPVLLLGLFLVATAILIARELVRYERDASLALQRTIEGIAGGSPTLPNFVATDELGDLAFSTAAVFSKLQRLAHALGQSALRLGGAALELRSSSEAQGQTLSQQASALSETMATAEEIRATARVAAQKALGVLETSRRAEALGESGERAVGHTLEGLQEIRTQVNEMAERIRSLEARSREIFSITDVVKDLADQSNVLALNAAVEAARAGQQGKGFAVVAREIRNLADQSLQSTARVRDILRDLGAATRSTVRLTEEGATRVESSLTQVREQGQVLTQLMAIVRENAVAARQIASAVDQQGAGIGQISGAVQNLSQMMEVTLVRVRSVEGALNVLGAEVEEVQGLVGEYGVDRLG
jgi:methyl-accepting chemotaxis protein